MPANTTGTIEYSTSSSGTITWVSSDETVATVVDNNDGTATVTAHTIGSATISATQAADATYAASTTKNITVNVSDSRTVTVTTIDASGITNTDLKTGTAAGQFAASVTAGGDAVDGVTVTWESSDPTIATIDGSGNVLLVKAGTTTITATYAGDATHAASIDTYELIVADSRQETEVTAVFNYTFFGLTPVGTAVYAQPDVENTSIVYKNVTFNAIRNDGTKVRYDADHLRLYNKNTLTITAPTGYYITNITLVSTGGDWATGMSANVGTYNDELDSDKKAYWVGFAQSVSFTPAGTHRIASAIVTLAEIKEITISAATWATFSCACEVEIPASVTAYYAAEKDASTVTLKEITGGYIPANTGVVVAGAEGTYPATVTTTGATLGGTNLLKPWTTEGEPSEAGDYYTLAVDGSNNPVFKQSTGGTLAAGKAYLVLPAGGARELSVSFGGETTGIDEVRGQKEYVRGECFNLAGQRVAQPTRGLYIVNGRKVVIK